MSTRVTKVRTVKSGEEYYATLEDDNSSVVLNLVLASPGRDRVIAYARTICLGSYKLSRFEDGKLSPKSIRKLFTV